jgi:hypothetical protein
MNNSHEEQTEKKASEIPRKVGRIGRPCLFDQLMTSTERWRCWRDSHRARLWPDEDASAEEIRQWELGSFAVGAVPGSRSDSGGRLSKLCK